MSTCQSKIGLRNRPVDRTEMGVKDMRGASHYIEIVTELSSSFRQLKISDQEYTWKTHNPRQMNM